MVALIVKSWKRKQTNRRLHSWEFQWVQADDVGKKILVWRYLGVGKIQHEVDAHGMSLNGRTSYATQHRSTDPRSFLSEAGALILHSCDIHSHWIILETVLLHKNIALLNRIINSTTLKHVINTFRWIYIHCTNVKSTLKPKINNNNLKNLQLSSWIIHLCINVVVIWNEVFFKLENSICKLIS